MAAPQSDADKLPNPARRRVTLMMIQSIRRPLNLWRYAALLLPPVITAIVIVAVVIAANAARTAKKSDETALRELAAAQPTTRDPLAQSFAMLDKDTQVVMKTAQSAADLLSQQAAKQNESASTVLSGINQWIELPSFGGGIFHGGSRRLPNPAWENAQRLASSARDNAAAIRNAAEVAAADASGLEARQTAVHQQMTAIVRFLQEERPGKATLSIPSSVTADRWSMIELTLTPLGDAPTGSTPVSLPDIPAGLYAAVRAQLVAPGFDVLPHEQNESAIDLEGKAHWLWGVRPSTGGPAFLTYRIDGRPYIPGHNDDNFEIAEAAVPITVQPKPWPDVLRDIVFGDHLEWFWGGVGALFLAAWGPIWAFFRRDRRFQET
jgi:hypothetical protein